MAGSPFRALLRAALYIVLTVPLMPVQAALILARSRFIGRFPRFYHRLSCRVLGIELRLLGKISPTHPTLFVANHISYLDIEVMGAAIDGCFVAKREVARWPFFGWLARLQRTVFIDRRVSRVHVERDEVARRLEAGDNLILFAEGTSSDGTHLRPFKSSLLSVAERNVAHEPLVVQPVTLAYTRLDGMPIGRQWRPFFGWYGDMEMLPHLWTVIGLGRITAELQFHAPVTLAALGSRKALADHCERVIGDGLSRANSGRLATAPSQPTPATPQPFAAEAAS